MLKVVFDNSANYMGDFYMYYQNPVTGGTAWGVCTAEITEPFMTSKYPIKVNLETEVLLWNWNYNKLVKVEYKKVKKLTPLSAILQNDR